MNEYIKTLNRLIENKRLELCNLITDYSLTNCKVIICSQELDDLLTLYELYKKYYLSKVA